MAIKDFSGVGVAIVTPFRTDGTVDFNSFREHMNYLITGGVSYILVLGTTGESVTLSKEEKNAVINFAIDTIEKRVPLVVGIGGNNTQGIIDIIKDTDFTSIDAILSVAPAYNKPTQEGIYEHYRNIASVCPKPIIMYNVPGRTSSNINAETTVKLAKNVENIVAIKEASGNMTQIMQIIKDKPKDFQVISGDDALTLPMISAGAEGVISVVANAFPAEFSKMVQLALSNKYDEARSIHYKLFDLINMLFAENNPGGIKAALDAKGLVGNFLRLPLMPVSQELYNKIKDFVK